MLGYTCLDIMLCLQCYGSPVGYEASDARIHLSRYNVMPTMLRGSPVGHEAYKARIHLSRYNAMLRGSPVGHEAYRARIRLSRYNTMPTTPRFTGRV